MLKKSMRNRSEQSRHRAQNLIPSLIERFKSNFNYSCRNITMKDNIQ